MQQGSRTCTLLEHKIVHEAERFTSKHYITKNVYVRHTNRGKTISLDIRCEIFCTPNVRPL